MCCLSFLVTICFYYARITASPTRVGFQVSIAAAGALAPLAELLHGDTVGVQEAASGALRNLAINPANQVTIAATGAVRPLVELAASGSACVREAATGALRALAGNEANRREMGQLGFCFPTYE